MMLAMRKILARRVPQEAARSCRLHLADMRDGDVVDVARLARGVTLGVACSILTPPEDESPRARLHDAEVARLISSNSPWMLRFPSALQWASFLLDLPRTTRKLMILRRARRQVRDCIERARGRPAGDAPADMLSLLIDGSETGGPMPDEFLADNLLNMLLAGYETSGNSLAWALWATAGDRSLQDTIAAEGMTLPDDPSRHETWMNDAHWTDATLRETLRLYPSVWLLCRASISDYRVGDYLRPGRHGVRDEPVGDAARSTVVRRPAALRSGAVGGRAGAVDRHRGWGGPDGGEAPAVRLFPVRRRQPILHRQGDFRVRRQHAAGRVLPRLDRGAGAWLRAAAEVLPDHAARRPDVDSGSPPLDFSDTIAAHPTPLVLQPGQGHAVEGPVGGQVVFNLRGLETDGRLMLTDSRVAPGEGPPIHMHPLEDKFFYVLDGRFRFRNHDDVTTTSAGAFVFVRRTVPHRFQNVGDGDGRLLVFFTPAGMETFYENLAALPGQDRSVEAFARAGAEAGMVVLGPTLAVSHEPR